MILYNRSRLVGIGRNTTVCVECMSIQIRSTLVGNWVQNNSGLTRVDQHHSYYAIARQLRDVVVVVVYNCSGNYRQRQVYLENQNQWCCYTQLEGGGIVILNQKLVVLLFTIRRWWYSYSQLESCGIVTRLCIVRRLMYYQKVVVLLESFDIIRWLWYCY